MKSDLYPPKTVRYPRRRAEDLRSIPQPLGLGWYALATIGTALGVLGQAWYSYQGRVTGYPSPEEFYVSLSLVFFPPAAIILSRHAARNARIGFLLYMALALLATRFMLYPTMFAFHDEIIHEWNVIAIDKTHHLFSANSLLPVTPYYPGIEIATSAVEHLTGLPLHAAATVVLFLLRVVMTLGLVLIFQMISGNVLISTTAALIYTVNPQYLYFNSEFSYQTAALPLCFFCVYVFSIRKRDLGIRGLAPTAIVAFAIAATHHLTAVGLVLILWTWYFYTRVKNRPTPGLAYFSILTTCAVAVWTWVARSEVIPYITEIVQKNILGISSLVGGSTGHKFFTDSSGDKALEWQVLLSLASVLLVTSILFPAGWYVFKNRRLISAASLALATAAALYPVVPAGHLSADTGEAADRAAGFIFVGLALTFAAWWRSPRAQQLYRTTRDRISDVSRRYKPPTTGRFRVPRLTWLPVVALTVCFAGGVVDGTGPNWAYGPGVYMVSADNRSIDQLSLQASYWEGLHIPAGSRIFSDRENAALAQTYGALDPLTSLGNGIKVGVVSELLLASPSIYDTEIACDNNVQFLIADQRLSTTMPHLGIYIDSGEYLSDTRTAPPLASALVKFDNVPGAERIFDNGAVRIYNLEGLSCQS